KTMILPTTACYRYDIKLISPIINRNLSETLRYNSWTKPKPERCPTAANLNLSGAGPQQMRNFSAVRHRIAAIHSKIRPKVG
ncbi:MAG TPA: hypothetical protein VIN67_06125, partial [Desulfobaccales bacterium]